MSTTQIARSIRTKKIGLLIYDARLAARRNIAECAEAIGASVDAFTEFEHGKKSPSLPELELLADYLEVPVEHFWGKTARSIKGPTRELLDWKDILPPRQQTIAARLHQEMLKAGLDAGSLADKTSIPVAQVAAYQSGQEAVPVPELEALATALGADPVEWMDQDGPVGERRNQLKMVEAFLSLSPEQQAFILQSNNQPYIEIAMHLSELPAGRLRAIAEGLLEITY